MSLTSMHCFLLVSLYSITFGEELISKSTYTVATVQYDPVIPENGKPIDILLANANRYVKYIEKVPENTSIIVFPEFGLSSLEDLYSSREELKTFSQDVPDPDKIQWNPCLNPNEHNNSQILHILSCAAKNNSVAVLANLVSHEPCENDDNCPPDGFYLFNTNVVFDKMGKLIARYHKHHLFFEPLLDPSPTPEYVTFDIDGITFACFICFDIYYEDPALKLVTQHGIKNIIFSTAWGNQMPFITGVQVFSRWARGLGINLIVSNYYKPQYGRLGTGIYSSQLGPIAETFDITTTGKLLTANIPINPSPVPRDLNECVTETTNEQTDQTSSSFVPFEMTKIPSTKQTQPIHKVFYENIENYTKILLNEKKNSASLCHLTICCTLDYELVKNNDSAYYALVAYDGVHVIDYFHAGVQTCAVMRCEDVNDIQSCASLAKTDSNTIFNNFILLASMTETVVFPSIVDTNMQLINDWHFAYRNCSNGKNEWIMKRNLVENLKSASIYARVYSRDKDLSNNL